MSDDKDRVDEIARGVQLGMARYEISQGLIGLAFAIALFIFAILFL